MLRPDAQIVERAILHLLMQGVKVASAQQIYHAVIDSGKVLSKHQIKEALTELNAEKIINISHVLDLEFLDPH